MTPTVTVNGLKLVGVELISSESPSFDSTVMSLLPTRTATVALDFKPKKRVVGQDFVIGPSREEEYYLKQFRSWAKTQKQEVPAMEKSRLTWTRRYFQTAFSLGQTAQTSTKISLPILKQSKNCFGRLSAILTPGAI
jgi:hypothetical protein